METPSKKVRVEEPQVAAFDPENLDQTPPDPMNTDIVMRLNSIDVAEVYSATLPVGQPPVVENLQQDI